MGRSLWGQTPRQSIAAACGRLGQPAVVAACLDLLAGRDTDPAMVRVLGGPRADRFLDVSPQHPFLRVWAARGLLWAWDASATQAVCSALADDAWRVREMAAKVVARHQVADALELVEQLQRDPVARARAAASRALVRLTSCP